MNKLDIQYTDLLKDILEHGIIKQDRTGTGTKSVFGRQIRHDMKEGFPLLTTKKMSWKSIAIELKWFLEGNTNIQFLVQNGCNIWNGDTYKNYIKVNEKNYEKIYNNPVLDVQPLELYNQDEFIEKIKTDDEFAKKWGELGPIYGKQWRKWQGWMDMSNVGVHAKGSLWFDQIKVLINDLKTNPDSRRLMVNAWNVAEIKDMVLPPCHYGFQCYTRELSEQERWNLYCETCNNLNTPSIKGSTNKEVMNEYYERYSIPTRAISLMWNQRSVDTFLGLPFNIASYALLLEMIAKEVNMVPDELIGNLGDTHLYLNHIDAANEQIGYKLTDDERFSYWFHNNKPNRDVVEEFEKLSPIGRELFLDNRDIPKFSREPFPLCSIKISDKKIKDISEYTFEDFTIENYKSHSTIKAPLSN